MGKLVESIVSPITGLLRGPEAPTPAPVPTAPDADEAALMQARQRAAARRQQGSGRASTLLTTGDQNGSGATKLGG